MAGTHLVWLECSDIVSDAQPGKFVMVRCGDETILPRPFSIHQCNGTKVALLFNIVGIGTSWLSSCSLSDKIALLGPLGNGFYIESASKNILMVAGGLGIAPLYSLAEDGLNRGKSVTMLYGTGDNQRYPVPLDINLVAATDDGTVGHQGPVTDLLLPECTDWADQIFACGPLAMYRDMAQMPELKGKRVQVSLEVRMGCGRGVCYGCTIKTKNGLKRVCEDGPVFNLDDVLWDELNY